MFSKWLWIYMVEADRGNSNPQSGNYKSLDCLDKWREIISV